MKDQGTYLSHILGFIEWIERYKSGGRESFYATELFQDAVFRNFELIGEVVKRLDDSVRQQAPISSGERLRDCVTYSSTRTQTYGWMSFGMRS